MFWPARSGPRPPAVDLLAPPTPSGRWSGWLGVLVLIPGLAALVAGFFFWTARGPQAPTEIFTGVIYGCERLVSTEEGSGLLHWARIDLTAPGIELYVTPL